MDAREILTFIGELVALIGTITACAVSISKVMSGTKCLLRSEMLRIYYKHKDSQQIRQYEYENFVYSYKAYKALGGNSFIDKIYSEVQTWEVHT